MARLHNYNLLEQKVDECLVLEHDRHFELIGRVRTHSHARTHTHLHTHTETSPSTHTGSGLDHLGCKAKMARSHNLLKEKVDEGLVFEHARHFELVGRGLRGVDDVIAELTKGAPLQHVHPHDVNAALQSERGVHV